MIFEYMISEEKHWMGFKLGKFVSRLVREKTVEELNALDRYELASRTWFRKLSDWDGDKVIDCLHDKQALDMFFEEAAMWIDERIPKAYKKWIEHIHDKSPAGIPIFCDENGNVEYGFQYHYEINLKRVQNKSTVFPKEKILATYKQKSYIEYLAEKNSFACNYSTIRNKMTMTEATAFIHYFKSKMTGIKPENFNDYFESVV